MRRELTLIAVCAMSVFGNAGQVKLETSLAQPTMQAGSDGKQTNFLKIGLTGFAVEQTKKRAAVNLALVIDKSGSMSGAKIRFAKQAALEAVERLRDDDIVSVVVYDSTVSTLLPATKASDRDALRRAIRSIEAGGSTALFAGISKGAAEVRKFKANNRVNRVILLSDGLANIGPSSPEALGELGSSLLEEGISVTTLGLGLDYNEDLMAKLAATSTGNHVFIESPDDLPRVFQNEFDEVLSVVAKDLEVHVRLSPGIRPVKLLSAVGDIEGQSVRLRLGQLYARQHRYYLLEIEVPSGEHGAENPVGSVEVRYMNMITETKDELTSRIAVRFDRNSERIAKDENVDVITKCAILSCNERNALATQVRDQGDVERAKKLLLDNKDQLSTLKRKYEGSSGYVDNAPQVELGIQANGEQSQNLDGLDYRRGRKLMNEFRNQIETQQSYGGRGKIDVSPSPKSN